MNIQVLGKRMARKEFRDLRYDLIFGPTYETAFIERYIAGFVKGYVEGREEMRRKFAINLLESTDFSMKRIAELLDVSLSFVADVKRSLVAE